MKEACTISGLANVSVRKEALLKTEVTYLRDEY